jgi:hypothetical protein
MFINAPNFYAELYNYFNLSEIFGAVSIRSTTETKCTVFVFRKEPRWRPLQTTIFSSTTQKGSQTVQYKITSTFHMF